MNNNTQPFNHISARREQYVSASEWTAAQHPARRALNRKMAPIKPVTTGIFANRLISVMAIVSCLIYLASRYHLLP